MQIGTGPSQTHIATRARRPRRALLILAGAIYFVVNYIIGAGFLALERRLTPHLKPRLS